MIKILLGGSPCTFWSIAQKNNRETEAKGIGWELFKNFLIAKQKFNPDYFLYENNKSAAQAIKDQISRELGVELMYINSALVSAQNRQRFYAFNWQVEQPEDRGILLKDILESSEDLTTNEKAYCLTASYAGSVPQNTIERNQRNMVAERIPEYSCEKSRPLTASYANKSSTEGSLPSNCFPDNPNKQVWDMIAEPARVGDLPNAKKATRISGIKRLGGLYGQVTRWEIYDTNGKSPTLTASMGMGGGHIPMYPTPTEKQEISQTNPNGSNNVYEVKDGLITIKGKQYPSKLSDGFYNIRKLTPIECERLQTLPDNYTAGVSNSQRYKGLGNGWTAEVIIHILNGALKDVPKDEEIVVLSMYDGIGTGRYCLDKMGFTNVKYFAYEIDKYAKQIAMKNYPDIIQMGDAFDLRNPDWTIGY